MIYKTDEKVYDATSNMQCEHCGERFGMHNPNTLECQEEQETSRLKISFKGKFQDPLFMVSREWVNARGNKTRFATVIFDTGMLRERECWRTWGLIVRGKLRRLGLFILSKLRP